MKHIKTMSKDEITAEYCSDDPLEMNAEEVCKLLDGKIVHMNDRGFDVLGVMHDGVLRPIYRTTLIDDVGIMYEVAADADPAPYIARLKKRAYGARIDEHGSLGVITEISDG